MSVGYINLSPGGVVTKVQFYNWYEVCLHLQVKAFCIYISFTTKNEWTELIQITNLQYFYFIYTRKSNQFICRSSINVMVTFDEE